METLHPPGYVLRTCHTIVVACRLKSPTCPKESRTALPYNQAILEVRRTKGAFRDYGRIPLPANQDMSTRWMPKFAPVNTSAYGPAISASVSSSYLTRYEKRFPSAYARPHILLIPFPRLLNRHLRTKPQYTLVFNHHGRFHPQRSSPAIRGTILTTIDVSSRGT